MATITLEGDWELKVLEELGGSLSTKLNRAVYEGAGVVADALRAEVEALPEDNRRGYIRNIEQNKYNVISSTLKAELLQYIGTSKIDKDEHSGAVGFGSGGCSSVVTKRYPKGIPLIMVARSINSGSSVRRKNPFVRRAAAKAKEAAMAAMAEAIKQDITE